MWDGWKQLLKIDKYSLKRVVKDTHRFLGGWKFTEYSFYGVTPVF